jgi:hypothetical protein
VVNATLQPLYSWVRDPVPILQKTGWAPGQAWTGAENLTFTGIRFMNRPTLSESLYRLHYHGSRRVIFTFTFNVTFLSMLYCCNWAK